MNKFTQSIALTGLLGSLFITPALANTVVVSGTLLKDATGTTFDTWNINMPVAGAFTVDVRAYEASQSNINTAGYYAADLNGDGELTWLDPDTHFYLNDGHLDATDALVRCDDTGNNCPVYQNGLTALTSPVTVVSHAQAETFVDGSIHFRRDPWFDVTMAAGSYSYLIADYSLSTAEAASGINGNDNFSAPSGFANPILDHADYQITFSSDTLNFSVSGNTINVAAVPVPAAVWLFGSAVAGFTALGRRKQSQAV